MDARVKPAHDESTFAAFGVAPDRLSDRNNKSMIPKSTGFRKRSCSSFELSGGCPFGPGHER
jgi:hypothetical protein